MPEVRLDGKVISPGSTSLGAIPIHANGGRLVTERLGPLKCPLLPHHLIRTTMPSKTDLTIGLLLQLILLAVAGLMILETWHRKDSLNLVGQESGVAPTKQTPSLPIELTPGQVTLQITYEHLTMETLPMVFTLSYTSSSAVAPAGNLVLVDSQWEQQADKLTLELGFVPKVEFEFTLGSGRKSP
ncbi:MAG: hypothetical protein ACI9D0_000700 [Bacteroidia bacterium]|jgi:hypothetical protein